LQFCILNHSADDAITPSVLQRIADAIEEQLYQDYAPFWQSSGVPVRVISSLSQARPDDCLLVIFDRPDQPGLLGWHTYSPDGHIYGRVFWEPIRASGGALTSGPDSLSATLSHEALEALQNPYVNLWAQMSATLFEPTEVCDRVESRSYAKNGVSVSDFLGPRAFRDGPGPYSYMAQAGLAPDLPDPWAIAEGGYVVRLDVTSGEMETSWGGAFPEWKKDLKQHGRKARGLARLGKKG